MVKKKRITIRSKLYNKLRLSIAIEFILFYNFWSDGLDYNNINV